MESLLASTITSAGGFVVAPIPITSKEHGIRLLNENYVIRSDNSCESRGVFLPAVESEDPELFQSTLDGFTKHWKKTEHARQTGNLYAIHSLSYSAYPYNVALRSLGECRVYFVFGKIVEMKHTIPSTKFKSFLKGTPAIGRLNPIEVIKQSNQ